MPSFDALIIGAGTNGLACATRLAHKGRNVLVLEAACAPGGAALGHEFAPGFHAPGLAHIANLLDPRVAEAMDLARHGLGFHLLASTSLAASGDHLVMRGNFGSDLSDTKDAAAWKTLRTQLLSFAGVLAPFKMITPPRLSRKAGNETLKLAKLGLAVRMLGKDDFREFMRMLLINVWDVLNDELTDDRLKGLLGFDATLGSWLGPRSPNSLILLLNRLAGEIEGQKAALALPKGGMGALAAAMAKSATAAGVTIRCGAPVDSLIIEGDHATGVRVNGADIAAPLIISAISPKTTFVDLVGPRHLDTGFVNRIRSQKSRGAAAKLHLALGALPDFRGADPRSRLVIAPDLNTVELAFNAVKYNEVPASPVMEIVIPSAHEPGHAPVGQHVLSAIVQYAPCDPKAGHDAARSAMLENTLSVLEDNAPGLRAQILHAELLMPYDIQAKYGMLGGNWHHGELSVEQMLFLRPLPGLGQYQTPIQGLWLASAGSHPGGGISGAAGWNAAERILKEGHA